VDQSYTPKHVNFQQGLTAHYNLFLVDPSSSGSGDSVLTDSAQYDVMETILDTNVANYGEFSKVTSTYFASAPPDSNFYHQDADGNLWRYNYGFSRLNSYTFLVAAVGAPVDVHWVLVAKPGSPVGTTWIAKYDSMLYQAFNIKIYLKDIATTMSDTTFVIAGESIKAEHIRHEVKAFDPTNTLNGSISIDTYFSPELGLTIEDYFRHSTIASPTFNGMAKGSLKIMTAK
jgi:hypothetical protein